MKYKIMKKNILIIIDSLGIGGAEKAMFSLANNLISCGHSIDLISCDNIIKLDIPKSINLHILGFKKSFLDYTRHSFKMKNLIKKLEKQNKKEFDLILVNLQKATRLMRFYKRENVHHIIHSTFSQSAFKNKNSFNIFLKKKKLQNIYNNLNIITVSNGIKNDFLDNLKIKPKSIQTIYNLIDKNEIESLSNKDINLDFKGYIIHVGRFDALKRHDILIEAFKKSNLNTKLVLVGDGNQKDNIVLKINELNLKNKVVLTGFQQNPYPYIKNAKLLVLSSDYEGLPTVLIEALFLKIPAISTNCPSGPSEILKDNLEQYLVEVNNADTLADKMIEVFNNPYEIKDKYTEDFEKDKILNQYLNLIKQ